jgi:hypothetical protein
MRGHSAVAIVRLQETVHPAVLRALLTTLGITTEQLVEYLAEP